MTYAQLRTPQSGKNGNEKSPIRDCESVASMAKYELMETKNSCVELNYSS
ncbi:MAG: hypothetical protein GWN41_09850 [Phycisphaerae bacterium]|nr:hypothetical protein [Phycisphaerae bacterium]